MKNRVELIVIGINVNDLTSSSIVTDDTGSIPGKEIALEETLEKCVNSLFEWCVGYSSSWVNIKMVEPYKDSMNNITIAYVCTVPDNIKLANDCKFLKIADITPVNIGERSFNLVYKAMQTRF